METNNAKAKVMKGKNLMSDVYQGITRSLDQASGKSSFAGVGVARVTATPKPPSNVSGR